MQVASYDPAMYKVMTQIEHVLNRPDMYISSTEKSPREERIYLPSDKKFTTGVINVPYGLERLFLEIISNAGDNVHRSRLAGVNPGIIDVALGKTTVSVTNYGIPIPVEIHPEHGILVPEMIFGSLLSSGNYEGDRTGAGLNGLGAKLTNIFSVNFLLEIVDLSRGVSYSQRWARNMSYKEEAVLIAYNAAEDPLPEGSIGRVRVTYEVDFPRFGYTQEEGYPIEALCLFMRHCIDTSVTCKIPVILNGEVYDMTNFKNYVDLLYPGKNRLFHYEWPLGTEVHRSKDGTEAARDTRILPNIEMSLVDTPDEGTHVSFVNGLLTPDGGSHVDSVYKAVGEKILAELNKEKKLLNISDVKSHLTVIILCRVVNPTYSSQSKTKLVKPATIKMNIAAKSLKIIEKWEFLKRLYFALEAKQFKELKKTDGKRVKFIDNDKLDDANNAGTPDSKNCILYIVEGDSAAQFVTSMTSFIPNGKDWIGMLPIRGKMLNVRNASALQMAKNKEITELKEALGIREGVDYMIPDNFEQLRYGRLCIAADSDSDGKHIVGLVSNLFDNNYDSLIKRNFICLFRTPIMKATKFGISVRFYTHGEYQAWKDQMICKTGVKGWHIDYYKGLGTLEDSDIKKELEDPQVTDLLYDEKTRETMDLVFKEDQADARKEWIHAYDETKTGTTHDKIMTMTEFLNKEMIEHSIDNVRRSIPGLDGLKEVQKKIIFIAMRDFKKKVKVAQMAGGVSKESAYHHGENCLGEAIVYMAQKWCGTNNVPLMEDIGQFGSREKGRTKHSHIRYIHTKPSAICGYLFKKDDIPLYDYVIDEGEIREPKSFFPVLPLHFLNGSLGIGTGHSTFIPSFNPVDLGNWFKCKILGEALPIMIPWYRGYTGEITMHVRNKKAKADSTGTMVEGKKLEFFRTTGRFKLIPKGIRVEELPLFIWNKDYKTWLNELMRDKKIHEYKDHCTKDTVSFDIFGFESPDLKKLGLVRNLSMMNMTILDERNLPRTYKNLDEALEHFYNWRITIYQKRKENMLQNILDDIKKMQEKIAFIIDVCTGKLLVMNRKKGDVHLDMDKLGHNRDLLKLGIANLTLDDAEDLKSQMLRRKDDYTNLANVAHGQLWINDIDDFLKCCKRLY